MAKYAGAFRLTPLPGISHNSLPNKDVVAIVVARHIYRRFHLIMQERTLDANSLMQYLFHLYTKYGKESAEIKTAQVNNSASKIPERPPNVTGACNITKAQKRKSRSESEQCHKSMGKHKRRRKSTIEYRRRNVKSVTSDNIGIDVPSQKGNIVVKKDNKKSSVKASADSSNVCISGENSLTNSSSETTKPSYFIRTLKVSINSKTGSLRICEVPDDAESTSRESVDRMICSKLTDDSVLDTSTTTTDKNGKESEETRLLDIINKAITTNRDDITRANNGSLNTVTGVSGVDCASDAHLLSEPAESACAVETCPTDGEASPSKDSIALQRSRRKSKPQKVVSLNESFGCSDDELTCDSLDLENIDTDWLDLDIDDIATSLSPVKELAVKPSDTGPDKSVYQCPECDVSTNRHDRLEKHIESLHRKPASGVKCSACGRSFSSTFALSSHEALTCRYSKRQFVCPLCRLRFNTADDLGGHRCSRNTKKPFKCPECDYASRQSHDMETHITLHGGTKKFSCDRCDFKTAWRKSLREHVLRHDGSKPFRCPVCEFACNDRRNLKYHVDGHSSAAKTEVCEVCGARFSRRRLLTIHRRIHSGAKTYKCPHCECASVSSANLAAHVAVHAKDKRHRCPLCGSSFRHPGLLRQHTLKIHTDLLQPYTCGSCDFVSSSKQGLNSHMKKHKRKSSKESDVREGMVSDDVLLNSSLVNSGKEIMNSHRNSGSFFKSGRSANVCVTSSSISSNSNHSESLTSHGDDRSPSDYLLSTSVSNYTVGASNTTFDVANGQRVRFCDDTCDETETIANDNTLPSKERTTVKTSTKGSTMSSDLLTRNEGNATDIQALSEGGQTTTEGLSNIDTIRELIMLAEGTYYDLPQNDYMSRDSVIDALQLADGTFDPGAILNLGMSREEFEMRLSHPHSSQADALYAMMNVLREFTANSDSATK